MGEITEKTQIAWWILPLGGIGIVIGLATMGHKVMSTVGTGITELTPSRGFAAQLATASTVVVASGTGLPISTTQTLVGAVLGVGFARGIAALNLGFYWLFSYRVMSVNCHNLTILGYRGGFAPSFSCRELRIYILFTQYWKQY
jgi:phosphate/sulfate permease